MKKIVLNFKKQLLTTGIALIAFNTVQAQCATSTNITNQGTGSISFMNQSTYTGGWGSYVQVHFGDGENAYGTGTSFSSNHQYLVNGTYLVTTDLFAYNPMDSSINCSTTDFDTVVVTGIPCSISASSIGTQQGGGIYDWYFYSTVSSSQQVYSSNWVITDSLGNYLQSWNGTNLNSASYTFPTSGFYNIGFSVMTYDSLTAAYCSDSVYTSINIGDSSVSAGCNLQVNVYANSLGGNNAVIYGVANSGTTSNYLTVEGQTYYNTDSLYHTFSGPGSYYVCYYAEDSTVASYCSDSTCVLYTISGPVQCNASFYLWEDSTNVGQWYAINYSVGTGAISYMWDFGDGTTSTLAYPLHNYAVPGNYTICLTVADGNGCSSSTCDSTSRMSQQMSTNGVIGSLTVTAPAAVGIADNHSVIAEPKMFPNPMTEISSVTFNSSLSTTGKIDVVNILGATVLSENVVIARGNNEFKLNTSTLNNGVYYVNIIAENRTLTTVKAIK